MRDRTRSKFPTCFRTPFNLPSPPMSGFSQRRFLLLSFSSRWQLVYLPSESPAAGAPLHSLSLQHITSSDQQSPAWDSQGKSHKLLLKGLWTINGKTGLPSAGLTLLLWGPHCHRTFFLQGVHRYRIKGWKILTQIRASLGKSFGIPSATLQSYIDRTD